MNREQAFELFLNEQEGRMKEFPALFVNHLNQHILEWKQLLLEQFAAASQLMKLHEKELAVYFYFSILKIDLPRHQYTIVLQVQDDQWYLDQEQIEIYFDASFLFEPLEQLRLTLEQDRQKYIGKIDQDQINHLIYDQLGRCGSTIAHYLRYLFRTIEAEPAFAELPKDDYWVIRWGEYGSDSEIIIQKDLSPKTTGDWEKAIIRLAKQPLSLACSYWYQGDFSGGSLREKGLSFICFHDCRLERFIFDRANLIGARFINCHFHHCSFSSSDLKDAEFLNCDFTETNFSDADLGGAIFSKELQQPPELSAEQLAQIYIREE